MAGIYLVRQASFVMKGKASLYMCMRLYFLIGCCCTLFADGFQSALHFSHSLSSSINTYICTLASYRSLYLYFSHTHRPSLSVRSHCETESRHYKIRQSYWKMNNMAVVKWLPAIRTTPTAERVQGRVRMSEPNTIGCELWQQAWRNAAVCERMCVFVHIYMCVCTHVSWSCTKSTAHSWPVIGEAEACHFPKLLLKSSDMSGQKRCWGTGCGLMGLATLQSSGCVAILPLRAVYTVVMLSESVPSNLKGVPDIIFLKLFCAKA